MAEQIFRWSVQLSLTRILMLLVLWGFAIILPGMIAPVYWFRNAPSWWDNGVIFLAVVIWLAHSGVHWVRLFDRRPQIILGPQSMTGGLLGAQAIPWQSLQDVELDAAWVTSGYASLLAEQARPESFNKANLVLGLGGKAKIISLLGLNAHPCEIVKAVKAAQRGG